jgi:predicted NAD-dependent protein-ADP-ribosyltransferase YbiA (DUF1768 family)
MDVKSGCGYPAAALSNFAPHPFVFDGVEVASMEGLLQAFKFDKEHIQVEICKLVGKAAKFRGKKKDWRVNQTLYWKGVAYPRKSQEYQELLDRAYNEMAKQSDSFRRALLATQNATITHSIGKSKEAETVLTEREFCSRLLKIRTELQDSTSKILTFQ